MCDIVTSILHKINAVQLQSERLIIAIDGNCAAGKTTLAARLQASFYCNVIHMDHFYLRSEQRTPERLDEPGGNVDYERFLSEVLIPLRQGWDFSYRPYDCQRQDFGEAISIQANTISIVEGSYSCHPVLRGYYDFCIFLSIDPEEQIRRVRQREGNDRAVTFISEWIPHEEKYFSTFNIKEHCDCFYIIAL